MKAEYYIKENEKVKCTLCPNTCLLNEGQFGVCKTRKREGNTIINPYHGIISSTSIDPMEKKPLYHFLPDTPIFSVGFYGCTLKCQFCQNYSISQYHPAFDEMKAYPDQILSILKQKKIKAIAFTYSEPTLYYEWVYETAKLCHESNIKTVLVTNGYLNPEPAEKLFKYIDAANVDLKSSTNEFYQNICRGKLEPVKEFIKLAFKSNVHLEITTLVITETNDNPEEIGEITEFIASISPDIPFHISRYHPAYNYTKNATSPEKIAQLINISKEKLHYVYGGNIPGHSDSYCHNCKTVLISRDFYNVHIQNLDERGNCSHCGEFNHFIMQ